MATVNGNDVLLFLGSTDNVPVYTPIVCLTNNTWGRTRSTTTTNTKCGAFKSNGSKDYSCTATGLQIVNPDSDETGHAALVDLFTNDTTRKWMIAPAIPKAGDEIITFEGVVNALNDSYPTEGFATFDLTINPDPTTVVESVNASATVVLTSNTVSAGNVAQSSTNQILFICKMVNLSGETPTDITAVLTGSYDASDISNVKLYVNGNAAIDGSQVLINTVAATTATSPHTFVFANTNTFTSGTHYFILTADIGAGADIGHTIIGSKLTFTGLAGTLTDTQSSTGGTKTVN